MNNNIKELIKIRKKFKASREQFGTVFLGKTCSIITNYENGRTPIPQDVLMLARVWERFLDDLRGENKCKSK